MLIGLDNKLLLGDESEPWHTVLESDKSSNFFWHMTTSKNGSVYIQEYGNAPTGLYTSADGEKWDLAATCNDIDKRARHFHDVVYDCYRDMLVATLGDKNYVRIASSDDGGRNWKPVYRGAWQVLPIAVLKDRLVFGMDSGISSGGIIVWTPYNGSLKISHLKWLKKDVGFMQMADLKLLSNGLWVAALGAPQTIIASSTLIDWCPVYSEGLCNKFNHSMAIAEGEDNVFFTTGKHVAYIKKSDLMKHVADCRYATKKHKAIVQRLRGIRHIIKSKYLNVIDSLSSES
jgi:hypothetical protein